MNVFDVHIFDLLTSERTREDFKGFIERTTGYPWDETPEMKVALLRIWESMNINMMEGLENNQIFTMEMSLLPVLVAMEQRGIMIDAGKIASIGERLSEDIERIEHEIYDLTSEKINLSSPKQVAELFVRLHIPLAKKNKTGYSVDTEVLEGLAKKYDIARLILDHRTFSKLRSTYIDTLLKSVNPRTKRVHTHYNQIGAATGRMSSENPNLQNIPTGTGYAEEIKACFIPAPGYTLMVADYSQIELRVLAFLSGDTALTDTFIRGEDIHARTAHFLFGEETHITSEMRRIAKTVNFGVIYGITGFGLSKSLSNSPMESTKYIENFYAEYPGVRIYYDAIVEKARESGYVETYFGRKRNIPAIHDANRMIRTAAEREAINMPIQGTAADMLKLAMIMIHSEIKRMKLSSHILLQVHDELVLEVKEGEEEQLEKLIRDAMENVIPDSPVPMRVDIHTGKNWAEAKR